MNKILKAINIDKVEPLKLRGKRPTQSIFHDLEMDFFRKHVDNFNKIWEVCKPSFDVGEDSVKFGKIVVFGTGNKDTNYERRYVQRNY